MGYAVHWHDSANKAHRRWFKHERDAEIAERELSRDHMHDVRILLSWVRGQ